MTKWTYLYSIYEVASVSRIDKITGLFCRISSLLWGSFAKKTCNFIDPTNQSHSIVNLVFHSIIYSLHFHRALRCLESTRVPRVLQCAAVCCSVLLCVAVCCSVLQRVAVRCSVLETEKKETEKQVNEIQQSRQAVRRCLAPWGRRIHHTRSLHR